MLDMGEMYAKIMGLINDIVNGVFIFKRNFEFKIRFFR